MQRKLIGSLAATCLVLAAVLWVTRGQGTGTEAWLSATLRLGLMLGALWLALPELTRTPRWAWLGLLLLVVLVALQPRLFLLGMAGLLLVAFLRPRLLKER